MYVEYTNSYYNSVIEDSIIKKNQNTQPIFQAKRHINSQSAQGTGQPSLNPREVQGKIKHTCSTYLLESMTFEREDAIVMDRHTE